MSPVSCDSRICENYLPLNGTMVPSTYSIKDFQKMSYYKSHTYLWLALFEALYFDGYLLLSCGRELLLT